MEKVFVNPVSVTTGFIRLTPPIRLPCRGTPPGRSGQKQQIPSPAMPPRRTPHPHCPPLCRRNRAPCTLAQSYRQRLPILIYGRIPVAFQLPKVRRLIGNFASNCFSSMKARSPLAFSVKSFMPQFQHALPEIITASTFAAVPVIQRLALVSTAASANFQTAFRCQILLSAVADIEEVRRGFYSLSAAASGGILFWRWRSIRHFALISTGGNRISMPLLLFR